MKIILAVAIAICTIFATAADAQFLTPSSGAATSPYQKQAESSSSCNGECLVTFPAVKQHTVLQNVSCAYSVASAGSSTLVTMVLSDGTTQYLLPETTGKTDASGNLDYVVNANILVYESKGSTVRFVSFFSGTSVGMHCLVTGYSD